MRLALLGVRGSTPAPGAAFARSGGHTSCVAVLADGRSAPSLVLDAGTGIRDLPSLTGQAFHGAVVLTHLHWDHVHGLPFCTALDHPGAQVQLWLPAQPGDADPRTVLARQMSPPFFPIDPGGLLGQWSFCFAAPGPLALDPSAGLRVSVAPVMHKGGATLAVRVDGDGASIGYVPDHTLSPVLGDVGADSAEAVELLHGVDLLLHDGQFLDSEAQLAASYGHATIGAAMSWADQCDVGRLVLTHHAPTRTDDELDALACRFTATAQGRPVSFARQGDLLAPR